MRDTLIISATVILSIITPILILYKVSDTVKKIITIVLKNNPIIPHALIFIAMYTISSVVAVVLIDYMNFYNDVKSYAHHIRITRNSGFTLGGIIFPCTYLFVVLSYRIIGKEKTKKIFVKYIIPAFVPIILTLWAAGFLIEHALYEQALHQNYHICDGPDDQHGRFKSRYLAAPGIGCEAFDTRAPSSDPHPSPPVSSAEASPRGH
jgi:hypothetical protein